MLLIVEAPIQRNTKEENEQLKQIVVAETFKQNPSKLAQKDIKASLIKKFQELKNSCSHRTYIGRYKFVWRKGLERTKLQMFLVSFIYNLRCLNYLLSS